MADYAGSSNVAVAATSTAVMAARNGKRIAFSITNLSALIVYMNMSMTANAVLTQGIALYPGMTITDSSGDVYKCWQGTITAIEATGAATLACWERVQG